MSRSNMTKTTEKKTTANPSLWWWCTKGSFLNYQKINESLSKGTLDLCKINFDTKL